MRAHFPNLHLSLNQQSFTSQMQTRVKTFWGACCEPLQKENDSVMCHFVTRFTSFIRNTRGSKAELLQLCAPCDHSWTKRMAHFATTAS